MSIVPTPYRIFLASPGDVDDERAKARAVVERVRAERRFRDRLNVQVFAWDQPGVGVAMEAGLTPQEAIARGLPKPEECDLVIVILWSRMGTPLPPAYRKGDGSRYRSGTEWEYVNAIEGFQRRAKPAVWLYHRTETLPAVPDDPEGASNREQLSELRSFLGALRNPDGSIAGGINPYATPDQFRVQFEHHLRDALERFVGDLVPSVPRAQLPLPKDHLVARPALLARVKALVSGPRAAGAPRLSRLCLHGLPGAGKSVLAAMFAEDQDVTNAYPDGILWTTLGQHPELLLRLSEWGRLLNDPNLAPTGYPDPQTATALLAQHLADKRCLLVVDDVWVPDHIRAFCVEGDHSLLLATTRQRSIADAVAMAAVDVGEMQQEEALELMARWSGPVGADDQITAVGLAAAVGYLPLALELIGARVARSSWSDYQSLWEQRRVDALKRGRRASGREDSVRDSFDLSLDALADDRAAYLQLGVFPEDTAFPVSAAQALWGCDAVEARERLLDFKDQALLLRGASERTHLFRLHDVPLEVARGHLGAAGITQAHAALVEGYRQRCTNRWASGTDDGYFHEHLAYHLRGAGDIDALLGLVQRDWMDAQFQRTLSHQAFARDVDTAFAAARQATPPRFVPLLCCALVYATLGSISTSVSPRILGVLARAGRGEQALGYAALIDSPQRACRAHVEIAKGLTAVGKVADARRSLGRAFAACQRMTDTYKQADQIGAIARAMADIGDVDGIERAWALALAMDSMSRQNAVNYVCEPLIRVGRLELALDFIASGQESERDKHWIETIIAETLLEMGRLEELRSEDPRIPGDARVSSVEYTLRNRAADGEIVDALAVARVAGPDYQPELLAAVVTGIGERGKWEDLGVALNVAEEIPESGLRAAALAQLTPLMALAYDQDRLLAVRDRIEDIKGDWERTRARTTVACALAAAGCLDLARELAAAQESSSSQIETLQEIALARAGAGDADTARAAAEAAAELLTSVVEPDLIHTQVRVLARLGDVRQANALVGDTPRRAVALVRGCAEAGLFDAARTALAAIGDDRDRDDALAHLAAGLGTGDAVDEALEHIRSIGSEKQRDAAFQALAVSVARHGAADAAERVAIAADDAQHDADVQGDVTSVLVEAGRLDAAAALAAHALARAQRIVDDSAKVLALLAIGRALAENGYVDDALSVLVEAGGGGWLPDGGTLADDLVRCGAGARVLVEACQRVAGDAREFALSQSAVALATGNGVAGAEQILTSLTHRWDRAAVLVALARRHQQDDDTGAAEATVERALNEVQDAAVWDRIWLLMQVGDVLRELGKHDRLRRIALALVPEAEALEDLDAKVQAVGGIAQCLATAGDVEQGIQLLTDEEYVRAAGFEWTLRGVIVAAARVSGPDRTVTLAEAHCHDLGHLLTDLADALLDVDENDAAVATARRALDIGLNTKDGRYRTSILRHAVPVLVRAGVPNLASQAAVAALEAAKLGDEQERPDDIMWAACALADAGEFTFAMEAANSLEDRSLSVRSLCTIIDALTRSGQADAARDVMVEALGPARLAGRPCVFEVAASSAAALAALNGGKSLSELLAAIRELDDWLV